jgi:hypothetical protein
MDELPMVVIQGAARGINNAIRDSPLFPQQREEQREFFAGAILGAGAGAGLALFVRIPFLDAGEPQT